MKYYNKLTIRDSASSSIWTISGYLLVPVVWMVISFYNREFAGKPFPYPWEAVFAIFHTDKSGINLFIHTGASLLRWGAGFALAALSGIFLGILTAYNRRFDILLSPLVTVIQLIPGLAWIPIALILFGLGNFSTIFMIAVTSLTPVLINTRGGITQIDPVIIKAIRMMELKKTDVFRKIIIPGAAPSVLSGLRVGAANGFRVLISAEMIVGSGLGLGFSLYQSRWSLDYNLSFGALILMAAIGLILERAVFSPIERRVKRSRGLE